MLALAIPLIFLHPNYQPSVTARGVTVDLTDIAIAAVIIAAIVVAARRGTATLRPGLRAWIPLVAFLVWLLASMAWARGFDPSYRLGAHTVSALKFVEYALLAPAVTLIVAAERDRRTLLWSVALWSSFLTLIAALQFLGLVNEFDGRRPEQREPSYIGIHDLAAFSGAALSIALVAILARRRGPLPVLAGIAGALGMALAAALDSVGGLVVAAATLLVLAPRVLGLTLRRAAAVVVIVVVVAVAAVSLRGSAVTAFLRFLGVKPENTATQTHVQSYAHRTLLGYIGLRIWLGHPILGVGWQESKESKAFRPYLAAAHRRFTSEPPQAFPSKTHEWGVQNGIIQTLADLGVIGFGLLVATVVGAFSLAVRALRRTSTLAFGLLMTAWLWIASAVFTGSGLLPGLADNALLWIAVGGAVALHGSLTEEG